MGVVKQKAIPGILVAMEMFCILLMAVDTQTHTCDKIVQN